MSCSLISTCRVRYKLKLLVRNQILSKSGPVVLRLKMHGNSPRPNSPSLPTVTGACRSAANGGAKESHWKTVQNFPCSLFYGQGAFPKTDRPLVTLERQRSPVTSPDKLSHQHSVELRVLLSLSQNWRCKAGTKQSKFKLAITSCLQCTLVLFCSGLGGNVGLPCTSSGMPWCEQANKSVVEGAWPRTGIAHTQPPRSVGHGQQLQLEERRAESKLRDKPDWPRYFQCLETPVWFCVCVSYGSLPEWLPLPQPKVLKELNLKPRTPNTPSHLPPPSPSPPTPQPTPLPKEETPPMHILGL